MNNLDTTFLGLNAFPLLCYYVKTGTFDTPAEHVFCQSDASILFTNSAQENSHCFNVFQIKYPKLAQYIARLI